MSKFMEPLTYRETIVVVAYDFQDFKHDFKKASIANENRASGICWAIARVFRKNLKEVAHDLVVEIEHISCS